MLNFKIGYFKWKPWPIARLLWSSFPEAMGKNDTPYVTHKNMKVWSIQYWTSKLVISRESLGQLQGFSEANFLRQWTKMIHPMLLTRTWRCDPLNIELQIWLFEGKALANCKAFVKPISWGNGQNNTPYVTHKNMKVWSTQYWTSNLVISRESLCQLQVFYGADFLTQ